MRKLSVIRDYQRAKVWEDHVVQRIAAIYLHIVFHHTLARSSGAVGRFLPHGYQAISVSPDCHYEEKVYR